MGVGGPKRFEDAVVVVLDGAELEIIELADAGRILLTKWPLDTRRRRKAMEAVAAALRGEAPIATAKRAFVDAALEVFALRMG
jgi:hypothetical protein